jgi:hypothetical protein
MAPGPELWSAASPASFTIEGPEDLIYALALVVTSAQLGRLFQPQDASNNFW